MKAIIYTEYGSPDVLHVAEVEKPVPNDDEILIRVRAAEATKTDCEFRSMKFPVQWFALPLRIALGFRKPRRQIMGGYFAGEVAEVGAEVSKFQVGDAIFGSAQLRLGGYGEYMCLPESYTLVPKPINMTFEEAAAVPLGGLNAIHFMREANIQAGDHVLVNGAGGSIGTFAVQIAKTMGAEVTAVDSGIKEEMLRRIGADHFVDYTKEDFSARSQKYDMILNMVAQSSFRKCVAALASGGCYYMANARIADMFRALYTSAVSDKKASFSVAGETEEELLALKEMIEAGEIFSTVDKIYAMEEAAEAHRWVETEQRLGSVVITISGE